MLGDSKVHAIVPTHDLASARRFYEDKIGAKVVDDMEGGGILFECGDGSEFLLYETVVDIPAQHTVMFFRVPDIDAAVTDLESRGITFENYDLEAMGYTDARAAKGKILRMEGIATSFFKDPEGNILSVTQYDS